MEEKNRMKKEYEEHKALAEKGSKEAEIKV